MNVTRTWACTHTEKRIYAVDGVNYAQLCTEANISRWGGIAEAALNLIIVVTVILSTYAARRSGGYEKYSKAGSWIPKWGRA